MCRTLLVVAALIVYTSSAMGQFTYADLEPGSWDPTLAGPGGTNVIGVDGTIWSMRSHDFDGTGGVKPVLMVGGAFDAAFTPGSSLRADSLVMWADFAGTTDHQFHPVGAGIVRTSSFHGIYDTTSVGTDFFVLGRGVEIRTDDSTTIALASSVPAYSVIGRVYMTGTSSGVPILEMEEIPLPAPALIEGVGGIGTVRFADSECLDSEGATCDTCAVPRLACVVEIGDACGVFSRTYWWDGAAWHQFGGDIYTQVGMGQYPRLIADVGELWDGSDFRPFLFGATFNRASGCAGTEVFSGLARYDSCDPLVSGWTPFGRPRTPACMGVSFDGDLYVGNQFGVIGNDGGAGASSYLNRIRVTQLPIPNWVDPPAITSNTSVFDMVTGHFCGISSMFVAGGVPNDPAQAPGTAFAGDLGGLARFTEPAAFGTNWSNMQQAFWYTNADVAPRALAVYEGVLYAGGGFGGIFGPGGGQIPARGFARWSCSRCALADIVAVGGTWPPDNQLTSDDLVTFVNAFSNGDDYLADVASVGNNHIPDGSITADDLIEFVNSFSDGCL